MTTNPHQIPELPDLQDEDDVPEHPLAHRFDPGTWSTGGHCICSAPLPPQSRWHHAGQDWAHIICPTCGWLYVDEEEYIAICDPTDDLYPTPEDEGCTECRGVLVRLAEPSAAALAADARSAAVLAGPPGPGDTGG